MDTLSQLEKKHRELQARHVQLLLEREKTEEEVTQLEAKSRRGRRIRVKDLGKSRLQQMTLSSDLAALEAELEATQEALERAKVWQRHDAKLKRLVELAQEAGAAREAFYAALASVKLGAHTAALVRAYQSMKVVRSTFIEIAVQLAPGLTILNKVEAHSDPEAARRMYAELDSLRAELEARGADLSAVCARFDSTMEETVWDISKVLPGL